VASTRPGVVSVVLVNFRGADDTIAALSGLAGLDWPTDRLQIIVLDNASGDDSVSRIKAAHPGVELIESAENLGFAGGCNAAVAEAEGEFIALLNNDARPDAQWVRAAVAAFDDDAVAVVASRVLDWDGERIDYVDAAVSWFGMAYKPLTGHPYVAGEHDEAKDVLFATGSAMFVRASDWRAAGGFDEKFFMFFEDVDLGWRLTLAGRTVRYVPGSIAYHRHHASMQKLGAYRESYLLERNALFLLFKNAGDDDLARWLPASLAMVARRAVQKGALDPGSLDIRRAGEGDGSGVDPVSRESLAGLFAIDQFVEALPQLTVDRERIQSSRVVDEATVHALMGETDDPPLADERTLAGYESVVNAFGVLQGPRRRRILVVTGDTIGRKLAGPGIRAWNICLALSAEHDVRLVSTASVEQLPAPFELAAVSRRRPGEMAEHERWADVIIVQGHVLLLFPVLAQTQKVLVVDIYDPMHLEQLEQAREKPFEQWVRQVADASDVLNHQLQLGDFFVCASERQRLFWLGQLASLGRVNAYTYERDNDLRTLVDIVPFGLSDEPPAHTRKALRGVVPGIGDDDRIIIWGGGLYNWFDPETLIRAVAELAATRPDVRLFFMGTTHPNPNVPEMDIVRRCRELADELGVTGRHVFFNDSWVGFEDRANYLLEADAGVSTHYQHVETTFSFRTRILDYLWAGLPIVTTDGDSFAELVGRRGLGEVVPERDVPALVAALERVLYDEEAAASARAAVAATAGEFAWSETLRPIVEFCRNPLKAADKAFLESTGVTQDRGAIERRYAAMRPGGIRYDVGRVAHYLRNGGVKTVLGKLKARRAGA
jgi:GT2 family glycosyltransferase/glycosyltransferase involved in cell wall biosynthesis